LILLFLGLSWSREIYKKYEINREIRALEGQIAGLERSNSDLSSLIGYFKSPEYKERQARQLLNLQKQGEFVVALPLTESESSGESALTPAQNKNANLQKWWLYFFAQKHEKK